MRQTLQSREFTRKRKVLIVEDNEMNREILAALLEDDYDIMTAEDGERGLAILSDHYRELSLVFLDVYMPVCDGFEFLRRVKGDALLSSVPIIVTTGSNKPEDEAKCLDLGASDFVPKPYNPKVVKGRARNIIKLKESVASLSAVEFDELTGLYTMEAFYHHADRLLASGMCDSYDLSSADVMEFKLINSVYGEKVGDEILTLMAREFYEYMPDSILARSGDKFFCLFPSANLKPVEEWEKCSEQIQKQSPIPNLNIKYGLYKDIDATQPMSLLCDRVLMAIAEIKHRQNVNLAYYDEATRAKRIRMQQMEAAFDDALKDGEFVVWYQPKYDPDTEEIVAAEALVRWAFKDGAMVSPGEFIPLFERDGRIHILDEYVFRKVCEFQKERVDAGLKVVPISVNLSRSSVYYEGTIQRYEKMVEEAGIDKFLVPIELTESAAIEGRRIQDLSEDLVTAGFTLHMDDFGSGYSSLSSLGTIPFGVLKIDKGLVDGIGTYRGDTVLTYTILIAQKLGMKVCAEGVEELPQVEFLKKAGCDMIQGYFYSPPKKQSIFEEMLEQE